MIDRLAAADGGAIGNAFANATGRRLHDLLFSPERVQAALG